MSKIQIPYTSQFYEEDGQIVAISPELNVSSFGDIVDEALAALQEKAPETHIRTNMTTDGMSRDRYFLSG